MSFQNNSIARKLTFIITLTAIIVLTISSVVLVVSQFYSSRIAITHELKILAEVSSFAVLANLKSYRCLSLIQRYNSSHEY